MTDEHFGISIVEYMAAGAIPIGSHFTLICFVYMFNLELKRVYLLSTRMKSNEQSVVNVVNILRTIFYLTSLKGLCFRHLSACLTNEQ